MSSNEIPTYIACVRVRAGQKPLVAKGTTKDNCSRCSHLIYVALTTADFRADHPDAKLICVECFFELTKDEPDTEIGVLPGTFEEVKKTIEQDRLERN